MMAWNIGVLAAAMMAVTCKTALAQEDQRRFKLIPFTDKTTDQRRYADAVMAGPTSATGSAAVVQGASAKLRCTTAIDLERRSQFGLFRSASPTGQHFFDSAIRHEPHQSDRDI
jgi:hypothetical protein